MLVLTRHRGQTIIIGDVQVTVANFKGDGVCLGITAPRHIPIHRKEVYEAAPHEDQRAPDPTPEGAGSTMSDSDDGDPGGRVSRLSHLFLWRRCNEAIMIGQDVTVTVVDIRRNPRPNKVRLGITAPRHVQVHRQEVFEAIMRGEQQLMPRTDRSGSNDPDPAGSELR